MSTHGEKGEPAMNRCIWAWVAAVVAFVFAGAIPVPGQAQPPTMAFENERWNATAKVGYLTGSEVCTRTNGGGEQCSEMGQGFILGADLETSLLPQLTAGVYNLTGFSQIKGAQATFVSVGITLKGRFNFERFSIRPGILLGYQINLFDNLLAGDPPQGFGLGIPLQILYEVSPSIGALLEVGVISQPIGGKVAGETTYDVVFGPTIYVLAGMSFGQ